VGLPDGLNASPDTGPVETGPTLFGQFRDDLFKQPNPVPQAVARIDWGRRVLPPVAAEAGQHQQMAGVVTRVDRRDVAGAQRLASLGVVPVVQVTVMVFEVPGRCHGGFQAFDGLAVADPAEVAGADHGEEVKADVGR